MFFSIFLDVFTLDIVSRIYSIEYVLNSNYVYIARSLRLVLDGNLIVSFWCVEKMISYKAKVASKQLSSFFELEEKTDTGG